MTRFFKTLCLTAFAAFIGSASFGQETLTAAPPPVATVKPDAGKCRCHADDMDLSKYTTENVMKWLAAFPLTVKCENKKIYKINYFELTTFTMNPMQQKTYGLGDDKDLPLLGKRILTTLKPGDSIILKQVKALDDKKAVNELPSVSIRLE